MLVARDKEKTLLQGSLESEYSQFIAVYGRRRVGKTFLIRESFGYHFAFEHAGLAKGTLDQQLAHFCDSLKDAGLTLPADKPTCWLDAFSLLKDLLRSAPEGKKVVFIDELSWMDTKGSDLMLALEGFWNGWASAQRDIVLVVCASATSWMLNEVVHNKGGLYNRLTAQINLKPFTLAECEQYLDANGIVLSRQDILECYMILGGVPYYWGFLRKGMSLTQNIDTMFFAPDAPLRHEFDFLYASIFDNPHNHLAVIGALGKKRVGMTREEIARHTPLTNSGTLTKVLRELESCGFIRTYTEYGKKKKGAVYQLIDNFTLFHFKFLADEPDDEHLWTHLLGTPRRTTWCGLAFELVCLEHLPQIKQGLGISGVVTHAHSWRCVGNADEGINGSQIDLLIARRDRVIDICEMKYANADFAVTKSYDQKLRDKAEDFRRVTGTRDAIHLVLVTTYGLKENTYAGRFQSVVTVEDLFAPTRSAY